jgi:hypothetical protein
MKSWVFPALFLSAFTGLLLSCSTPQYVLKNYHPDDQALYDTIMRLDSSFFHAYNTCNTNLEQYAAFFLEDIEFYHDKGGLATSKADIVEGTRKYVCGKVTRQLVKGSTEVYPVADFGAIEIGYHTFWNHAEANSKPSRPGRFVIAWQRNPDGWKIKRVISLH